MLLMRRASPTPPAPVARDSVEIDGMCARRDQRGRSPPQAPPSSTSSRRAPDGAALAAWSIKPVSAGLIGKIAAAARALALDIFSVIMVRSPVDHRALPLRTRWQIDISVSAWPRSNVSTRPGRRTILKRPRSSGPKLRPNHQFRNNVPYRCASKSTATGTSPKRHDSDHHRGGVQMRADRISKGMRGVAVADIYLISEKSSPALNRIANQMLVKMLRRK